MKANSWPSIIILIFITFCIITIAMPGGYWISEKENATKCKANLSQLGKGLNLYLLDVGRQVLYPQKNGQGFILELYRQKIIIEKTLYSCPDTDDELSNFDIDNLPDLGDSKGPVSYAGRKNQNQNIYPGIFQATKEMTTTVVMSDDMGEANHQFKHHDSSPYEMTNFLFLDGHVDNINSNNPHSEKKNNLEVMFDVLAN